MNHIRRNTDPMKGPADGVAVDIQCAVTQFEQIKGKKGQRKISGQGTMPCTIYCSYSDGTMGVSIRGIDLQIDLLVPEVMAILQAAAEANAELTAPQREAYTDEVLEEKWRELHTIGWDEADSPSGIITDKAWWVFPQGVDRDDLFQWFGERHSKGIEYLQGLID